MAEYIEYHLARHAQGLPDTGKAKKSETLLTNALGVLNEQGIYALFLYLRAEREADVAKRIGEGILKFLADQKIHGDVEWSVAFRRANRATAIQFDDRDLFTKLQTLCKSRDDLFYAHGLLEQLLTYARYHAKALPEKAKQTQKNAPEQQEAEPEPVPEAAQEAPLGQVAQTPQRATDKEPVQSERIKGRVDLSQFESGSKKR